MCEAAIASAFLAVLPSKRFGLASVFTSDGRVPADSETVKGLLLYRLETAAERLTDIALATKTVSKKLVKNNEPDINTVLCGTAKELCRSCSKNSVSWGSGYSETMDDVRLCSDPEVR